jgi:hypothetical protein
LWTGEEVVGGFGLEEGGLEVGGETDGCFVEVF